MVLGLAAAMVGGLVVFIWLYIQSDRNEPPDEDTKDSLPPTGGLTIVLSNPVTHGTGATPYPKRPENWC